MAQEIQHYFTIFDDDIDNINNLFDEQYYTRIIANYKTGYMGDGRSAVVALNYKF